MTGFFSDSQQAVRARIRLSAFLGDTETRVGVWENENNRFPMNVISNSSNYYPRSLSVYRNTGKVFFNFFCNKTQEKFLYHFLYQLIYKFSLPQHKIDLTAVAWSLLVNLTTKWSRSPLLKLRIPFLSCWFLNFLVKVSFI
jgi:hypothetical protein